MYVLNPVNTDINSCPRVGDQSGGDLCLSEITSRPFHDNRYDVEVESISRSVTIYIARQIVFRTFCIFIKKCKFIPQAVSSHEG